MRVRHLVPPVVLAVAVAGCAAAPGTPAPPVPEPPVPPIACLLDTAALEAATGIAWTVDEATAGDLRCVYDPASAAGADTSAGTDGGREFVTVTREPLPGDAATRLDEIAQLCDAGTRAPVDPVGFTCTYGGGSAYAVVVRDEQLVVAAASGTPEGTTSDRLRTAFAAQLPG